MFLKLGSFGWAVLICTLGPVLSSVGKSVLECPQKSYEEQRYPYVVYGNPEACHVAGRQGPCSNGSILYAQPQSNFGVCTCECFLDEGIVFDDKAFRDYRYCFNARVGQIFVHDKKRCACYQLGSQGPCPSGQVFKKDIYEENPKCVSSANREDHSNKPNTPIETERCPPGTIYSTLLNICTDMNFKGLSKNNGSANSTSNGSVVTGKCPPGTIYSELLNICTDMSFMGLPPRPTTPSPNQPSTGVTGKCPPGTIYSTLLNKCTDMSFTGLPPTTPSPNHPSTGVTGKCPPGTIYSTLLNICTDMSFTGLPPSTPSPTTRAPGKCPPGTIYSTLLNICTDMNFTGLPPKRRRGKCPPGTIYSTLLNKCTDMNFRGLIKNSV